MTSDLPQHVQNTASRHQLDRYVTDEPLVVGVSGGADSLALLHALCVLRGKQAAKTLHVAHLDHGFRGEAGAKDAAFVKDVAQSLGVPFTGAKYDVPEYARSRGLSKEEAARRVRYAFLAGLAEQRGATVAVAHTADDQVETVLMNVLRGTGLKGLAGMQMLSTLPVSQEVLDLPVPT